MEFLPTVLKVEVSVVCPKVQAHGDQLWVLLGGLLLSPIVHGRIHVWQERSDSLGADSNLVQFFRGEHFTHGAEGVLRHVVNPLQHKGIQGVGEVRVHIEPYHPCPKGDILTKENRQAVLSVAQRQDKTVQVVQAVAIDQQAVRSRLSGFTRKKSGWKGWPGFTMEAASGAEQFLSMKCTIRLL